MFNIIAGNSKVSSGTALSLDENPVKNIKLLHKVSIISDKMRFNPTLSLSKILNEHNVCNSHFDLTKANRIISLFNLSLDKKYSKLSTGMKAQFNIAIGLSLNSEITLLDEPVAGLDSSSRRKFYNLIVEDFIENPRLIIISTHLISELEKCIDSIIIINKGNIIYSCDIEVLQQKMIRLDGSIKLINILTQDKKIYDEQEIMGVKSVVIINSLSSEERKFIESNNINISKVNLDLIQDYICSEEL